MTDYSSVLFDFLATGSHLVLWMPDRDRYDAARGRYPVELPVGECVTVDEVAAAVRGPVDRPAMAAARARYAPRDDGGATARVLDVMAAAGDPPRPSVDLEPGS
ncbi:MAG: CDP-glycerol glycerophosphotransferase family protein [Candidatus Nanopelagicales bacterium]